MLELAAMKGLFGDITEEPVTYVNAPLVAKERGVEVSLSTDEVSQDWRNLLTIRGTAPDGQLVSVSGTLSGLRQTERLVEVQRPGRRDRHGRPHDFPRLCRPARRRRHRRPDPRQSSDQHRQMQVCRHAQGGDALIVLSVDSAVPADLVSEIATVIGAGLARVVDLDGN